MCGALASRLNSLYAQDCCLVPLRLAHLLDAAVTVPWPTGSPVLCLSTRQQMAQSSSRLPIAYCELRVPRDGSPSSTSFPTAFRSPSLRVASAVPTVGKPGARDGERHRSGDQLSSFPTRRAHHAFQKLACAHLKPPSPPLAAAAALRANADQPSNSHGIFAAGWGQTSALYIG